MAAAFIFIRVIIALLFDVSEVVNTRSGGTRSSLGKNTFGGGGPAILTFGVTTFTSFSPSGRWDAALDFCGEIFEGRVWRSSNFSTVREERKTTARQ